MSLKIENKIQYPQSENISFTLNTSSVTHRHTVDLPLSSQLLRKSEISFAISTGSDERCFSTKQAVSRSSLIKFSQQNITALGYRIVAE